MRTFVFSTLSVTLTGVFVIGATCCSFPTSANGLDRGAHYDVILKFENRKQWGGLLLHRVQGENDPIFQDMVNVSQRHFMGADVMKVVLKHYTVSTLDVVKRLYKKDIELFGYADDVKFLENVIKTRRQ